MVRLRFVLASVVLSVVGSVFAGAAGAAGAAGTGFGLRTVATADRPIGFARAPSGAFFVIEQQGKIRAFDGTKLGATVLDVHAEISDGGEQGLLGAAFANDGRWLYVNITNTDGNTEIRAYPFADGLADKSRMVTLLNVDQPYANHNGGGLVVDDTGVLWIGLGDGGSAGDPENRAQNLDSLLGKMLRIVPTPDDLKPYRIPSGNVEVSRGRPEIWAWGLRNPWRFSIDAVTKTLWIGDVGQGDREEIDAIAVSATGANFGWKLREGTRAYNGGEKPAGYIEPVHDYSHATGGCSVTGGVVYRGSALASLRGAYLFSDYCDGKVRIARRTLSGGPVSVRMSGLALKGAASFGVDAAGEVYIASAEGPIAKLVRR